MRMWEHPTSLLAVPSNTYIGQTAALYMAPLNTNTSNGAALFRALTKQLRNASGSPFQGPKQTYAKLAAALFRAPRYRVSLC